MNYSKKSFSISEQIFFAQRLSLMLDSGISLIESLHIIKSIDNSIKHKKIYEFIINNCEQGVSLYKSMLLSKVKFDPLLITLIKNGELSGSLVASLLQVAKNLEKRNELKKRLISTLIYPVFIFIATLSMALFLVLYIFPKILPMLISMNIKLPLLTIAVKTIYEVSISHGFYIIIFLLSFIGIVFLLIKKNNYFRLLFHKSILIIPVYESYFKTNTLASICGIGEMFLSSGKSLSDFHYFVSDSAESIVYKNTFKYIYNQSLQGISFSNSMKEFPELFLQTMIDMCALGEKTGNVSAMLGHCSRIFEQDIDIFLKRFSALIEPTLMIFMGLIVGSIALSIILPVYEITNHLTK